MNRHPDPRPLRFMRAMILALALLCVSVGGQAVLAYSEAPTNAETYQRPASPG
jgi:hypothetical protein